MDTWVGFHHVRKCVPHRILPVGQRPQDAEFRNAGPCWQSKYLRNRLRQRGAVEVETFRRQRSRLLLREAVNRFRFQLGHLAARRGQQGLVFFQHQFRFRPGIGDSRAAVEPAVHRFAVFLRVAVIRRSDEVRDVVFRAKQTIQMLQPMVGRFVAAGVEVVLLLRQDDDGFWRERGQEVFVVQAQRQRAWRALFHVRSELVFHISPELGDETARGRHGPTIFDAAEPGRHGSAAGIAGDAEVAHVHFFARHQVIERANAVPGAPHPETLVDEHLLNAGVVVLSGPCAVHGFQARVHVLHALALANRIEDQHHIAQTRQSLTEGLIRLNRFAVIRMSARGHHTRKWKAPPLGNIKIRRHQKPWAAFE